MNSERKIKVLGISGSLRKQSFNSALLRASLELKPIKMEIEIFNLIDIPMYNSDVEQEGLPESVRIFKEKISAADSLLIASPEYNFSVTGAMKNAIDWASRPPNNSPLNGKPFAIMGASGGTSGTIRSQMHFRQIAILNNMHAMNVPGVYVQVAKTKFNENLELTDEATREHLKNFLDAFYKWTIRFD